MPTNAPTAAAIVSLRFVILEHTGTPSYKPGVHWDLLCEEGEILRAWEFREPLTVPQQEVVALPNHRRVYLDYEGPISSDRGSVRRIAEGTYERLLDTPTEWTVKLDGLIFQGELRLIRQLPEAASWNAIFLPSRQSPCNP